MNGRMYRTIWLLAAATLLLGIAAAAWASLRWLARSQGNAEEVFAKIQVGMSQQEAVAVLLTFDASSGRRSSGTTVDQRCFHTLHRGHPALDDLPPAAELHGAVLSALDSYGREIEVTLGPGGIVTGKQLSPGLWEHRWNKARRELRDKPYPVLLRKYGPGAMGVLLALALLAAAAWRPRSVATLKTPGG